MNFVNKILEGLYSGVMVGGGIVASNYNGEAEWFTKGYLHDATLPIGAYFLNKFTGSLLGKNEWVNAAFAFLGCSAFEIAQGLGLFPGTFDPKDFLAYAAGAGLAVAMDKVTFRKKNLDGLVEDSI